MTAEERVREFCRKVEELEKEYEVVLWAYSGTGDIMVSTYTKDGETEQEFEFFIAKDDK